MESRSVFNPRLMIGLVAAGILAFAAFMVLAAYAGDFRAGRDGRSHALSVSAVGYRGLVDLIGYTGGFSDFAREEIDFETEDLLVLALEWQTDSEALASLIALREAKPTLIILPKWMSAADPTHPGWVAKIGESNAELEELASLAGKKAELADLPARTVARGTDILDGVQVAVPRKSQVISGEAVVPLLALPDGRAVLAQVGSGPLFVLAEPDLLNNQGLKNPATARAALEIVNALNSTDAESIWFDLTLNGLGRKPDALKMIFEPPFVAFTLALFVAALLAGYHGAVRFGPVTADARAIAFGKAALVENSAGLLRMARREHRAGAAYADLIRDEAARATAAPPSLQGDELEAYLDRITPPHVRPFTDLANAVRAATDRTSLAAAAHDLFLWKKELLQ